MSSEPSPNILEICFNLWVVADEETQFVYSYMGKAYGLRGTKEEKLRILHKLSADDHHTVPRRKLPDRFRLMNTDGDLKGVTRLSAVRDPNSCFWDELLEILEKELPSQTRFLGGQSVALRIPIRRDCLCVSTVLLEDKFGIPNPQIQPLKI